MSGNDFSGKVVLVTGSGRGIGRNIAQAFAARGARVAVCDIEEERGAEVVGAITGAGRSAHFYPSDLAQPNGAKALIGAVLQREERIDILINNARAPGRASFAEETEAGWDAIMAVNLRAPFFLAQAAIPHMKEASSIINICSVSSFLVSLESPAYQASKAGLMHLTRYLAVAAGVRKIRCNAIMPGFIVQDEHRARYEADDNVAYRKKVEANHPLKNAPGQSNDIAHAALFLASDQAQFITGQALVIDGGFTIQDSWAATFSQEIKS